MEHVSTAISKLGSSRLRERASETIRATVEASLCSRQRNSRTPWCSAYLRSSRVQSSDDTDSCLQEIDILHLLCQVPVTTRIVSRQPRTTSEACAPPTASAERDQSGHSDWASGLGFLVLLKPRKVERILEFAKNKWGAYCVLILYFRVQPFLGN